VRKRVSNEEEVNVKGRGRYSLDLYQGPNRLRKIEIIVSQKYSPTGAKGKSAKVEKRPLARRTPRASYLGQRGKEK
jgi:hypothetical protein